MSAIGRSTYTAIMEHSSHIPTTNDLPTPEKPSQQSWINNNRGQMADHTDSGHRHICETCRLPFSCDGDDCNTERGCLVVKFCFGCDAAERAEVERKAKQGSI